MLEEIKMRDHLLFRSSLRLEPSSLIAFVFLQAVSSVSPGYAQELPGAISPGCRAYQADPVFAQCDQKLGLPPAEAAAFLTPSQREFLDRVKRVFREDGLLLDRAQAIRVLGADIEKTDARLLQGVNGSRQRMRFDLLRSQGDFTASAYGSRSTYRYEGPLEAERTLPGAKFHVSLRVQIDWKLECIPSMAAEGYLDIPFTTSRNAAHGAVKGGYQIDRRTQTGVYEAGAWPLSGRHPELAVAYVDGCLASVDLHNYFNLSEVSDDKVYK